MKKIITSLIFSSVIIAAYSQPIPDSVLAHYHSVKLNWDKSNYLWNYFRPLQSDSNNVKKALEILSYFKKQNDETGSAVTQIYIASRLNRKGDYNTALNMLLPILHECEKRKDTVGIIYCYKMISNCFDFARNYEQAIVWQKKAIPVVTAMKNEVALSDIFNSLGATYAKALMPDSGLVYAQKAVTIDLKLHNIVYLSYSLSTLAENYIANKNYDLALPFLRKAQVHAQAVSETWALAYVNLDLAQSFFGLKNYDSTIYYAHRSIEYSANFKETLMKSYDILFRSYDHMGRQDSAFKYFRLVSDIKDSIYSLEKTNNAQAINFREQLRQQEIETEITKVKEERKNNIQYAAIGIGIIFFISIFLLLSRSIIVNEKWITFLGILGLLVVFEFINLLFHPLIESFTNHSPILMLLILVGIASLLIPVHHRLEKWIREKITEKNKQIRLAAAKKTIEQLEADKNQSAG